MLSAREIDLSKNPNATGWVNQRIVFTHGVGVAMVPVNEVASQGQPQLIISNLPPVSSGGAPPISEPRIYFGEGNNSYAVVDAKQPEFDYPRGVGDVGHGRERRDDEVDRHDGHPARARRSIGSSSPSASATSTS